ncbi:MAG: LytTR family DNA-binding domain-containing protein [Oscillospiraceae bacterium]
MIKIAICDDDKYICKNVEKMLLVYANNNGLNFNVEAFFSGEELFNKIQNLVRYDIFLLDIKMFEVNGLDIGRYIRKDLNDYSAKIIYISAEEQYMKEMFKVQPLDFLKKPINTQELYQVLDLACKLIAGEERKFFYKKGHDTHSVFLKDILYFTGFGRKITITMIDTVDEFYGKISEVLAKLDNSKFIQVHKSYIANYDYIITIKSNEIEMANNFTIAISRNLKDNVRNKHLQFIKETNNP